jgi:hypothetical protein
VEEHLIYELYISSLANNADEIYMGWGNPSALPHGLTTQQLLTAALENTDHTFVAKVTQSTTLYWENMMKKNGWEKYIAFEMAEAVTNPVHPERPRTCKVVVLKGVGK